MSISLKAIVSKLNDTTRKALEDAAGLCLARTHYNVEVEHFLTKLLDMPDCDFPRILKQFGVDKARPRGGARRAVWTSSRPAMRARRHSAPRCSGC